LRGVRFLKPLFRGVRLLETDVTNRRRALDTLYAHQMRRVDGLEADVELASRRAAEADRRAGAPVRLEAQTEPSPFEDSTLKAQAERFFTALGAYLERVQRGGAVAGTPADVASVPHRLIVALDNIDALPQAKIRPLLDAAHRAFANSGVVTMIAADPAQLAEAVETDGVALEKWIQVPFRLGAPIDYTAFVEHVIGRAGGDSGAISETQHPMLDWSISAHESGLLAALAPLAGGSPRAVKRFVNLYRIARARAPELEGALAFMQALDLGGTPYEIATVRNAIAEGEADAGLDLRQGGPRLVAALEAVETAEGKVTVDTARRAAAVARTYSLRP
jgi:hypothetical protein